MINCFGLFYSIFLIISIIKNEFYALNNVIIGYIFVKKLSMLLPQSVWALDKVGSVSVVVVWYEVDSY